jgi:hypothetical protein
MPDLQKIKPTTNVIQPQATVIQTEQVELAHPIGGSDNI